MANRLGKFVCEMVGAKQEHTDFITKMGERIANVIQEEMDIGPKSQGWHSVVAATCGCKCLTQLGVGMLDMIARNTRPGTSDDEKSLTDEECDEFLDDMIAVYQKHINKITNHFTADN